MGFDRGDDRGWVHTGDTAKGEHSTQRVNSHCTQRVDTGRGLTGVKAVEQQEREQPPILGIGKVTAAQ